MERVSGGRKTTIFDDYIYTQQVDNAIRIRADAEPVPVSVGSQTVVFQ